MLAVLSAVCLGISSSCRGPLGFEFASNPDCFVLARLAGIPASSTTDTFRDKSLKRKRADDDEEDMATTSSTAAKKPKSESSSGPAPKPTEGKADVKDAKTPVAETKGPEIPVIRNENFDIEAYAGGYGGFTKVLSGFGERSERADGARGFCRSSACCSLPSAAPMCKSRRSAWYAVVWGGSNAHSRLLQAIDELKKGTNSSLYLEAVSRAREVLQDKLGDEWGLDQNWVKNVNRAATEQQTRLEVDLNNQKRDQEREPTRVRPPSLRVSLALSSSRCVVAESVRVAGQLLHGARRVHAGADQLHHDEGLLRQQQADAGHVPGRDQGQHPRRLAQLRQHPRRPRQEPAWCARAAASLCACHRLISRLVARQTRTTSRARRSTPRWASTLSRVRALLASWPRLRSN